MGKNSGEFLRNFSKLSLKTVILHKSLILGTNSREFLRNFSKLGLKTVILQKSLILGTNSREFLETESKNCDPTKIFHLRDQFWGISREFPRNQLQEMILEKFLGNSLKKATTVGESGESPHFCYLGSTCPFTEFLAPLSRQCC